MNRVKAKDLSPEKRIEWERQLNADATLYYIGISLSEYALMNMQSNPTLVQERRLAAGQRRKQLKKLISEVASSGKRLNMEAQFKKEDEDVDYRIGAMASIVYMCAALPTEQLYSLVEKNEQFCRDEIDTWLQDRVDDGTYQLKVWTMNDGKLYKFVHNIKNIEELLGEFYKAKGKNGSVRDFISYCRIKGNFISTLD